MPNQSLLHPLPTAPAASPPDLPARFTYPFHYTPHPLTLTAATDLQEHLKSLDPLTYDFGFAELDQPGSKGKMFGVLVVEKPDGELAYLAAFSGKLANSNHHPGFVPPVYDVLDKGGFYKAGEREVNALNARIDELAANPAIPKLTEQIKQARADMAVDIAAEKKVRKAAKKERDARRKAGAGLPETERTVLEKILAKESVMRHFVLKDKTRQWEAKIAELEAELASHTAEIEALKKQRKEQSNNLQQRIFQHYNFLDADGNTQDLLDIFSQTVFLTPPAGAGECAAPKLLQYAYLYKLKPIALAEFWWGQPPPSAIRKHGRYYPACRGKCGPILGHMLGGLDVDPNPMEDNPAAGKDLPVVYEDDDLLVVNKPSGFLSVPGKLITDSVQTRMEERFPAARGHLIVHRLDMSTSGLLLITKRKEIHRLLQQQFFKRSIKKRYVAVLEGVVQGKEGFIDLPLRGDFEDRPRQLVDPVNGKTARTRWQVVERLAEGRTRVHLWPVTGRTHQLRVHCAHSLGLNASIVGDELYGVLGGRLLLHAEELRFTHPGTKEELVITAPAEF